MRRLSFIPVFLTGLTVVFVIALVVRLRSYSDQPAIPTGSSPTTTVITRPGSTTTVAPVPGMTMPNASSPPRLTRRLKTREILSDLQSGGPARTPSQPGSAAAKVSAAKQPLPPSHPESTSRRTGSSGSSSSSPTTDQRRRDEASDPNSDTTPPKLLSIEFVPPQVQDGQETSLVIVANDDLSGVRGISGTIISPSGKAMQGFSEQRDADITRFVGRVLIPKDAEAGLWHVNVVSLSDNASNSVTLSWLQGAIPQTAVLRVVSSGSDSTPPTLKNVWIDRPAMRAGEKDTVFVEADDDRSGVNLASVTFVSPARHARIGAGCAHGDGDLWRCEIFVPTCIDCGSWQLEQVTLQDKANNLANFRLDNPLVQNVKVSITGEGCDSEAPVLQSVLLSSNDIVVAHDGANVTVTLMVVDDGCGVAGISGQYAGPGIGSGGFFPLQQSSGNMFVGTIHLDPLAARGTWRIMSMQLTDRARNLRVYRNTDPQLAGAVFQLR
jgi:hypothetical protein